MRGPVSAGIGETKGETPFALSLCFLNEDVGPTLSVLWFNHQGLFTCGCLNAHPRGPGRTSGGKVGWAQQLHADQKTCAVSGSAWHDIGHIPPSFCGHVGPESVKRSRLQAFNDLQANVSERPGER